MAKALKTVGVIAGAVALVATGLGAVGVPAIAGLSTSTIAGIATVTAGVANIGAQALAKPPPVRGSVTQIQIAPDALQPYCMGEGYFAGFLRHDVGYGATLKKVPNPYRFMPIVYSGGGPVQSISPRVDFATVSSWYSGFLYTDTQVGACPEPDALSPQWPGAPGWSSASKLSGQPAIGWSFLFDKDGKRFANGIPPLGAYGQWVKVYDPRKDSTQPGGVGSHRLGIESTYEYSASPALHAGTYAYGRYQNGNGPLRDGTPATGKRTIGMGLPADGIDWAVIAAWANVCTANGWNNFFGVVYEPGDRWANLKDICFAGGAEPVAGGKLTFKYSAPKVALGTITVDDMTDDNRSITGMQPFRDRINTVVPKYRSPAHNWEMIDGQPVVNSGFLAEDGEEKRDVWPFNFVKELTQATQLAAYRMFDSRELPFTVPCKAHMRHFRAGECLEVIDPDLGVNTLAIIQHRHIDAATMKVTFEMITETVAKHAYCLGQTGVAPPTPAIGQTAQERDELAAAATATELGTIKLSSSYTRGLAGNITQVHNGAGTGTVTLTIPDHIRVYGDGTEAAVEGGTVTLNESTSYLLSYDDPNFSGGEIGSDLTIVKINRTAGNPAGNAYFSQAYPSRHYLASVVTVNAAGTGGGTGGSSPPGGGGWGGTDGTTPGTEIP